MAGAGEVLGMCVVFPFCANGARRVGYVKQSGFGVADGKVTFISDLMPFFP